MGSRHPGIFKSFGTVIFAVRTWEDRDENGRACRLLLADIYLLCLFEKAIAQSQIIMFPGGFSAGDEPDGSAKFFATAFQRQRPSGEVMPSIEA